MLGDKTCFLYNIYFVIKIWYNSGRNQPHSQFDSKCSIFYTFKIWSSCYKQTSVAAMVMKGKWWEDYKYIEILF